MKKEIYSCVKVAQNLNPRHGQSFVLHLHQTVEWKQRVSLVAWIPIPSYFCCVSYSVCSSPNCQVQGKREQSHCISADLPKESQVMKPDLLLQTSM